MDHEYDVVIHAARVVTPEGEAARTVCVRDGVVVAVEAFDPGLVGTYRADRVVSLNDDEVLIPGLVDTHVHVNDPGRTEWEGFRSATRAAAAGGVTTLIDMPLNSIPPTCDLGALELKRETARRSCFVDVGFWGGAVPGNLAALGDMHEAGVFGFKCFLLHSGVDEFAPLTGPELEAAMDELAAFGAMMIVHAEDAHVISEAPEADGRAYDDFLASRPGEAETRAIAQVIAAAKRTGCRAHILHLANAEALPMITAARADGVDISVETCPHYLTLAAEEIADGATEFKCCPPIREAANQDLLWEGLASGAIDFIVSDHSPCTLDLKRLDVGDFGLAWGGISSIQLALSAIWTAARRRGFALSDVVRWMAERPAERAGLTRKGRIAAGADADFAVFAPEDEYTVDVKALFHKNPVTPYAGRTFAGRVRATWLRGVDITAAVSTDGQPLGRLLTRGEK